MEYQYYEFQAIDRPLNKDEQDFVKSLSRRVELTSRQAIFTYSHGDFRGDPLDVLEYCFDAMFYQANWGTTQLAFRFPNSALKPQQIEPYCIGDSIDLFTRDECTILNIIITDEEVMNWIEPEGKLSDLLPLRDALLQGDLRLLYIAWLKAAQYEHVIDPEMESMPEPPVPPNLQALSTSLQHFIEVFDIDPNLVAFAAEGSTAQDTPSDHFDAWVPLLSEAERNAFLVRLAQGDPRARMELVSRLHEVGNLPAPPTTDTSMRRTLQDLLTGASTYTHRRKARK